MISKLLHALFGHLYTSTACQHALHERCRRVCKYCGASCRCGCHVHHR